MAQTAGSWCSARAHDGGVPPDTTVDWELLGESPSDRFGSAVCAGDVDGDGVRDVIVGASGARGLRGAVYAYSGATRAPLWRRSGDPSSLLFGATVDCGADVDGDGLGDVVAASSGGQAARVFSGPTGTPVVSWEPARPPEGWGRALTMGPDADGDGVADVIVGAPTTAWAGELRGAVYVYSAMTGELVWSRLGDDDRLAFGQALAPARDRDGDGELDLLVGAPERDTLAQSDAGRVHLFSSADANRLGTVDEDGTGFEFGAALTELEDLDGDGVPELLIGAPDYDEVALPNVGAAFVYSGRTAAPMFGVFGDYVRSEFGWAVADAGDVDGDGSTDLIVGAPADSDGGRASVFSGRNGTPLTTFRTELEPGERAGDRQFGFSVANAGDLDGDGRPDLVIGEPGYIPRSGQSDRGRVSVGFPLPAR